MMKKLRSLLSVFLIVLLLYSCSSNDISGTYAIQTVNNQSLAEGGLKTLSIQVTKFKEGQVDIAYYAIDVNNNEYSHNWENVPYDSDGNLTETLSNNKLYFLSGSFSEGKCLLKILEPTKTNGYSLSGERL